MADQDAGQGAAAEHDLLTRFIIFEPAEEGPNPLTWRIVGAELGRDRNNAANKFYADGEPPLHVAVSENQWKPRQPRVAPFQVPDRVDGTAAPAGTAREADDDA